MTEAAGELHPPGTPPGPSSFRRRSRFTSRFMSAEDICFSEMCEARIKALPRSTPYHGIPSSSSLSNTPRRPTVSSFKIEPPCLQFSDESPITPLTVNLFKSIHVLICDDESVGREILSTYVNRYFEEIEILTNSRIEVAESVEKAVELYKELSNNSQTPEIIFTDYNLEEGRTGADLAHQINCIADESKISRPSIILVSGQTLDGEKGLFYATLLKPLTYDAFEKLMVDWRRNQSNTKRSTLPKTAENTPSDDMPDISPPQD